MMVGKSTSDILVSAEHKFVIHDFEFVIVSGNR